MKLGVIGRTDLVERYAAMAAGIGWTRGVLEQAGTLDYLATLPTQLHLPFSGGIAVLGVHAQDGDAVVRDLRRRRHPNAAFVQTVLTGERD
jgi:hypothetical protein